MKKLVPVLMVALLSATAMRVSANTEHVIIENGSSALSNEAARQSKEQWNDTHMLRNKVNSRVEKEFDKADRAFDTRDKCEQSANLNTYWEPNTLRCLDRRTGRPVLP